MTPPTRTISFASLMALVACSIGPGADIGPPLPPLPQRRPERSFGPPVELPKKPREPTRAEVLAAEKRARKAAKRKAEG